MVAGNLLQRLSHTCSHKHTRAEAQHLAFWGTYPSERLVISLGLKVGILPHIEAGQLVSLPAQKAPAVIGADLTANI